MKQFSKLDRLKKGELVITLRKGGEKVIKGYLMQENNKTYFKIKAKKEYLENTSPFLDIPKLTDKKTCLHCNKNIIVGDYKILIQEEISGNMTSFIDIITCPNSDCDGTLIDWI